jgi:replicative DNA helicase
LNTTLNTYVTNAVSQTAKVMPYVLEMEQAVLGALLLDKDAFLNVMDLISESSFYDEKHKVIFNAMSELWSAAVHIDALNVISHLRSKGNIRESGGVKYIAFLSNTVNSAANIETHAEIVSQNAIKRELIKASIEIIHNTGVEDTDSLELLNETEQTLFKISEKNIKKNYASSGEIFKKTIAELDLKKHNNKNGVTGVPSGFKAFDDLTGGWQKTELSIIAARPAMGKTAFVVSAMRNAAIDHNVPVAIFSLEMSATQLMVRILSSEAQINGENLRKGDLESYQWELLHSKSKVIGNAPIFIDDTPALSVLDLRAKCRRLKNVHNIQMVIIDYLQLMTGDDGSGTQFSREQEIATISRALKNLSKELDIPVIALSQLSRAVEAREDKRPQLSDLRESGSIEQDADMVMFLYRPEYYKIQNLQDGTDTKGLGELIVAKNRAGSTDNIRLQFIGQYTKFCDWGTGFSEALPSAVNARFGLDAFNNQTKPAEDPFGTNDGDIDLDDIDKDIY